METAVAGYLTRMRSDPREIRPATRALSGTTAVVLGGAGFIGSWLCEALLEAGAHVHCVDSLVTGSRRNVAHLQEHVGFRLAEADITTWIPEVGPVDWVIHLASPGAPSHYLRRPRETLLAGSVGTFNALDYAARHGARLLLASSSEVYGDPLVHPQREDYWGNANPVGVRSVYHEAKRFSEALTASYTRDGIVDAAIARIFTTYGPRMATDDARLVPALVRQALAGRPMTIAGDGSRSHSLCWIEDTVAGLLALLTSRIAGPVNIGSDEEVTPAEVARQIRAATDTAVPIVSVAEPEDDPHLRRPDLGLARTELGWSPRTSLEDGVRRMVAAERAATGTPVGR